MFTSLGKAPSVSREIKQGLCWGRERCVVEVGLGEWKTENFGESRQLGAARKTPQMLIISKQTVLTIYVQWKHILLSQSTNRKRQRSNDYQCIRSRSLTCQDEEPIHIGKTVLERTTASVLSASVPKQLVFMCQRPLVTIEGYILYDWWHNYGGQGEWISQQEIRHLLRRLLLELFVTKTLRPEAFTHLSRDEQPSWILTCEFAWMLFQ